jgi:ABC-2 type transport system ATP-binding protein
MMGLPTVQVIGIEKSFLRTRALDGVTFDASAGITGLLGPNGAGKTTLLRMMATVLAPDSGSLRLLGWDPAKADERLAIRRRLGYMPQEPGFHRNFTTFEFVDYVAILKEMTDRRPRLDEVRRVLELVGLERVMDKKIKALSGGMRRRVALAQSFLGDPDLLVLDEPTAGLDPEQRLRFREIVSERSADRTVILSTHQTEDVAAMCPRVVVLNDGRTLFDGTPRELADVARGRVWLADERDPAVHLSWRTGAGLHRNIGNAPSGADLVEPTVEDGYLLLVGRRALEEEAA